MAAPYLSVLVPVYNEAENIATLGEVIHNSLSKLAKPYEVIFVDDGSKDASFTELRLICARFPNFKVVRLGNNFGQTAGLQAGIAASSGEVIGCLDADLQNDPSDIPAMLAKLDEGFDVVSGWRRDRKDTWLTRRFPSQVANWLISKTTGVPLHDYGCTLKLYRASYLKGINLYGEMHRFIPAFLGFMGARVVETEVSHHPRRRGVSKYGLTRVFKVALDLITVTFMDRYMTKPIRLFGGGGFLMVLAGVAMAAFTLYKKIFLHTFVKDQPLFQVSIFFCLIGLQLILMGLLAEIMIRIYYDIKAKPSYFVREKVGF